MEKLDHERYLKRVIIVCWIALAICFGIKLFGGNLFEIMCENENFIKVCEYADNHFWARYLIYCVQCFGSLYFFTLAVMQEIKYTTKQLILVCVTVLLGTFIKLMNTNFGFVFDIWQGFIMPCLFTFKMPKKHWNVLIGNILLVVFQLISMFVKNISAVVVTNEGVLVTSIYIIDVILMILLYFAYMNVIKERRKQ